MVASLRAAVLAGLVSGCLAENPPLDSGTSSGMATDSDPDTGTTVPPDSLLGCASATCRLLFVAESFDDRVEIFAPDDPVNQYRGAIGFDLRPGTDSEFLDEPFGIVLRDDWLHVMAGHYPARDRGTLVSIPRTLLGEYTVGMDVPVDRLILGGAFQAPVVGTAFGVPEPIFAVDRPLFGRLVIGAFNNDLFSTETNWTQPGLVFVVDPADPTTFGTATLSNLEGMQCNGAAQIVTLEHDGRVAVACDGNEAVAFLQLGELGTGGVEAAAAAIAGTVCDLPPLDNRRLRYLAYDGIDGVLVGLGPGLDDPLASGQVYWVRSNCSVEPLDIGTNGNAHPAQIVRVGGAFLVATGTPIEGSPDAKRGIYVVDANTGLCEAPLPGFDAFWSTPGTTIEPYALAIDGTNLAVGAGVNPVHATGNVQDVAYGKILWATLEGVEDPCSMTATVVDLTDGELGHAPAADPLLPTTVRRAPHVVVIDEVAG